MMADLVHHYTVCSHLPSIVGYGFLIPSSAGAVAGAETALLWFSADQKWEATATKMYGQHGGVIRNLSFEEQLNKFGCCRFSLHADDPRLLPWKRACTAARIPKRTKLALEAAGRRQGGDPRDWFALSEQLPIEGLPFDNYMDGVWQASNPAVVAERWESRSIAAA